MSKYINLYEINTYDIFEDEAEDLYTLIEECIDENSRVKVVALPTGETKWMKGDEKVKKIENGFKLDKNEYLKNPNECPFCKEEGTLETGSEYARDGDPTILIKEIECNTCCETFIEEYKLINIRKE
jgi:hypothetical protein